MKQKINNGDEFECVSKFWRSVVNLPWKKIKKRLNKRYRKESKQLVKQEINNIEE